MIDITEVVVESSTLTMLCSVVWRMPCYAPLFDLWRGPRPWVLKQRSRRRSARLRLFQRLNLCCRDTRSVCPRAAWPRERMEVGAGSESQFPCGWAARTTTQRGGTAIPKSGQQPGLHAGVEVVEGLRSVRCGRIWPIIERSTS